MTTAERRAKIEAAARVWWHSEDGDYHFQSLVDLISRLVDEAVVEEQMALREIIAREEIGADIERAKPYSQPRVATCRRILAALDAWEKAGE